MLGAVRGRSGPPEIVIDLRKGDSQSLAQRVGSVRPGRGAVVGATRALAGRGAGANFWTPVRTIVVEDVRRTAAVSMPRPRRVLRGPTHGSPQRARPRLRDLRRQLVVNVAAAKALLVQGAAAPLHRRHRQAHACPTSRGGLLQPRGHRRPRQGHAHAPWTGHHRDARKVLARERRVPKRCSHCRTLDDPHGELHRFDPLASDPPATDLPQNLESSTT